MAHVLTPDASEPDNPNTEPPSPHFNYPRDILLNARNHRLNAYLESRRRMLREAQWVSLSGKYFSRQWELAERVRQPGDPLR